jgi:hypothetical protein
VCSDRDQDRPLLRASHILGWSVCESDEQRLDVYNGILLCAHLDAAFDAALMSFDKNGGPLFSQRLSQEARHLLVESVGDRQSLLPIGTKGISNSIEPASISRPRKFSVGLRSRRDMFRPVRE